MIHPENPPGPQARELFLGALEKQTPEERAAFLDGACRGDAGLRAAVEVLLAHHREDSFLEDPALAAPTVITPSAEQAGSTIGPYKLREQIGEGGFGTVWVADQEHPVRRRVALKIIKMGMDTKEVIARFEQERQALAMMDHPNISRVLDAGATEQGRPYFVMELVRGVKITEYCDDQQLSTEERLALFITICQAVQHAHQKGIIHRDLKPSNILVTINDGVAVPKVIDFGVAKATQGRLTDHTVYTQFQQMVGTPLYMSPEQAQMTSLDIDTRSDIYSLGVLLYELLTGRTPIDTATMAQAGMDEIRRLIREVDPPKPSARVKTLGGAELTTMAKRRHTDAAKLPGTLRGDLDWIVMKCIEKDRKRRYDTATGLALDLQRHLANEVVIARPPTAGYLLGKLVRRHKLAFAAGAAIAASLVIGTVVSVWQAVRADREATVSAAALEELRASAPAFAEQARALVSKERFDEALEKLAYAAKLRLDAPEYRIAQGDILESQFHLMEAAAAYRTALALRPGDGRSKANIALCEELLAAPPGEHGDLSRESLSRLHLAMQQQQRPAAELMPVARLLGEQNKHVVDYWLTRLKELPISTDRPLDKRLTVRDDGRLAIDLGGTKVSDLTPLTDAPVAVLNLSGAGELASIAALHGMSLTELNLSSTKVADLSPLREMRSLEKLQLNLTPVSDLTPLQGLRLKTADFTGCPVSDISPLHGAPLEDLNLSETRVANLSPITGMPLKHIDLSMAPVLDFKPLAGLALEKCYLQRNRITDLSVLRGMPLRELVLWGCADARGYSVLPEIKTLELLLLPYEYRDLPKEDLTAIGALRNLPRLRQLGSEIMNHMGYAATGSKDVFWRDWDQEEGYFQALRKAGLKFSYAKVSGGTYSLTMENQSCDDLSLLKGVPISELTLSRCHVSDLTPLRGMPLVYLNLPFNPLSDVSALRGMPLRTLYLEETNVSDLSPLLGLPLKSLYLNGCNQLKDVAAVADIPSLENVTVPTGAKGIDALHKLSHLKMLAFEMTDGAPWIPRFTAEDFWKATAADGWVTRLRNMRVHYSVSRLPSGKYSISIKHQPFSDLAMFKGFPVSELRLEECQVKDLAPLRDFRLRVLGLSGNPVENLEPLSGMPLEDLFLQNTPVSDLSPLKGLPLKNLYLHNCEKLTDLSPLAAIESLERITVPIRARKIETLHHLPHVKWLAFRPDEKRSDYPDTTAETFWRHFDANQWLTRLRDSGVKIKTLKQQDDLTWVVILEGPTITNLTALAGAPVSILSFGKTSVSDLSPLRGMAIKKIYFYETKVTDINPLQGMPLEVLNMGATKVADLSVLKGMPLTSVRLSDCTEVTDLSPLRECRTLKDLSLPPNVKDIGFLRDFPELERLSFREDPSRGHRPDKTAEEFWKEYDGKKPQGK